VHPSSDAASRYAARVDAEREQRARLLSPRGERADRWASRASYFRLDPHRDLDANASAVLSLIEPLDTVIDIGGGAGRIGLPAALRCTEVLNIEPSPAMRAEFEAAAREAGIGNARTLARSWPDGSDGLDGDVVIASNVTYFVRDILPFVEAMDRAAERLWVITVWSVPPPDRFADLFQLVYGEPLARAPNHLDLLAALWEAGILANLRVLPGLFRGSDANLTSREAAVAYALDVVEASNLPGARDAVERSFSNLFRTEGDVYEPAWMPVDSRELVITWTPRPSPGDGG
jgi:hypothetical protein